MSSIPLSKRIAAAAGLSGALVGILVLWMWHDAGWSRASFSPDYGGPVAPLAAVLFILLGAAITCVALAPTATFARKTALFAGGTTLLVAIGVTLRGRFTSPDFAAWRSGAPEFIGFIPIGNMSPIAAVGFILTGLSLLALVKAIPRRAVAWGLEWVLSGIGGMMSLLVLFSYLSGPPLMSGERLIPIALPAAVSLLLLNGALFVLGAPASVREALNPRDLDERNTVRRQFAIGAVGVAMLLALAGLVNVRREQAQARDTVFEQLDAVAQLKAAQIEDWRRERLKEAEFLRRTPALARDTEALLARKDDPDARRNALRWIENIVQAGRYEAASFFDASGVPLLPRDNVTFSNPPRGLVGAIARGEIWLTDVYQTADDPSARLDLIVPISDDGVRPPRVAIVLRIDPAQALFPLISRWPVPTVSAEMLLARQEGASIRYLNRLRSPDPDAGSRPIPWAADPPRGEEPAHLFEGRDYRGILTLSALRRVGDTPWIVEAKVDRAEAYAPIRAAALQTGALVALLLLAVALFAAFIWRARQTAYLTRVLNAERQRHALAERLTLITENANDVIFLFDRDMKIVEANERVRVMHGRSPEEMKALTLLDLHPPETRDMARDAFKRIFNGSPGVFETKHLRADGELIPVEISAQPVTVGGERFQLALVRDISQRKTQQAEIERLNRLYAALSEVNASIIRAGTSSFFEDACRALGSRGGFPMVWIGRLSDSGRVEPVAQHGDPGGFLDRLKELASASPVPRGPAVRAIADDRAFSCQDHLDNPATEPWRQSAAAFGFAATIALPIRVGGRAWGALSVYATEFGAFGASEVALLQDVAEAVALGIEHVERETRRAAAQEASGASEARALAIQHRLNATLNAIPDLMFEMSLDGEYLAVHSPRSEMLAAPVADLNGRTVHQVLPEAAAAEVMAAIREANETGLSFGRQIEIPLPPPEGNSWFELSVSRGPDGPRLEPRFLVLSRNITNRKNAENALRASVREKSALLKEVHHRVKNNLQVIASLLRLESDRDAEAGVKNVLREMQGRVHSMALIHETLYGTGDFARVNLTEYLRRLAQQLFRAQNADPSRVRLTMEMDEVTLDLDRAIPCGLITNELLSNCLKYAFPNGLAGEVRLSISRSSPSVRLRVEDTGVGLAADFEKRRAGSLGLQLVTDLAQQLGGRLDIEPGPGARFLVTFPDTKAQSAEIPVGSIRSSVSAG